MSSAVVVAGLAAVLSALVLVAAVGEVATARARAQTAADAAALAAVGASPLTGGSGESCRAASSAAERNGARLTSCSAGAGWALRVDVAVAVRPGAWLRLAPSVTARAAAALEPDP